MTAPYSIGSDLWPGLSKLIEEQGEVGQVIGKIMGTGGEAAHWDGGPPLNERLEDELGDLMAAIDFVVAKNGLDAARITQRAGKKLRTFMRWHAALPPQATAPAKSTDAPAFGVAEDAQRKSEGARSCRRCSDCEGEEHHWMYVGDEDAAGEPVMSCKHCEATRAVGDGDD